MMPTVASPDPAAGRSDRWMLRLLVGAAMALVGVVLAVALIIGGIVWRAVVPEKTELGRCRTLLLTTCTDVPQELLEHHMQVQIPAGGRIVDSRAEPGIDTRISATVVVPASGAATWRQSLAAWPAPTACAPRTRCSEKMGDGWRSYRETQQGDGSLRIELEWVGD